MDTSDVKGGEKNEEDAEDPKDRPVGAGVRPHGMRFRTMQLGLPKSILERMHRARPFLLQRFRTPPPPIVESKNTPEFMFVEPQSEEALTAHP